MIELPESVARTSKVAQRAGKRRGRRHSHRGSSVTSVGGYSVHEAVSGPGGKRQAGQFGLTAQGSSHMRSPFSDTPSPAC